MPELPGLNRPVTLGRRATPDDFGADAAAATAAVAAPLSALGQISGQIVNARESARSSLSVAEAKVELRAFTDQLQRDPLQTAGRPGVTQLDLLRDERTRIAERRSKDLTGPWRSNFEDAFEVAGDEATLRVSNNVRSRTIKAGRADAVRNVEMLADEGGLAETTAEVAKIRGELDGLVEGWVVSGLITPDEGLTFANDFERGVSKAKRTRAIREDPAAAFLELQNPESELLIGLSTAEAEVEKDGARQAFFARLQENRSSVRFAQQQSDRVEKEADDAADQTALDLLSGNKLVELKQHLTDTHGVLKRERRQYYLDRIAAGGGFGGVTVSDPGNYVEARALARRGDITIEGLEDLFRKNKISKPDLISLSKLTNEKRFGEPEEFLKRNLDVGEMAVGRARFVALARGTEALRSWDDWMLDNPNATRKEAFAEVRLLVQEAALIDLGGLEIAQLLPRYKVFKADGTTLDFDAMQKQVVALMDLPAGDPNQITVAAGAEQLERIKRMSSARAQEAENKAARTEAKK